MSDVTSVAVCFRTLQAICDLRALARSASDETLARISAGIINASAEVDLRQAIGAHGCRLTGSAVRDLHLALVLAATLPNDDRSAFVVSTALLLADRLQRGEGTDDLFWHWDAFNDHYRRLADPERAAIMNGFRRAHDEGLVSLDDPPAGEDLCTEPFADTVALARALESPELREALISALTLGQTEAVAAFWLEARGDLPDPSNSPITRIMRHILESTRDFDPFDGVTFPVQISIAPVLPFQPG